MNLWNYQRDNQLHIFIAWKPTSTMFVGFLK